MASTLSVSRRSRADQKQALIDPCASGNCEPAFRDKIGIFKNEAKKVKEENGLGIRDWLREGWFVPPSYVLGFLLMVATGGT